VRLALTATLLLPLATGVTLQSQALPAPAGSAAAVESLSDELAAAVVRLPRGGTIFCIGAGGRWSRLMIRCRSC
jgi:hypothetical protein